MLRNFTLSLADFGYAIAYQCNYDPPVQSVGEYFGRVYPDGGLFGKLYADLASLGSGTHHLQLDERKHTPHGTKPNFDDGREQFELYRLVLFGYDHGVFTRTEVLMQALLACSERYLNKVFSFAPDFLIQSMRDFASQLPNDLNERPLEHFDFFSNVGTTRIPDQNLERLRNMLGKIAG